MNCRQNRRQNYDELMTNAQPMAFSNLRGARELWGTQYMDYERQLGDEVYFQPSSSVDRQLE